MLLCSLTMGCVLLCSALFSSFRLFSSPSFLPSFLLSFLPSFPLPLFPSLAASLPRSQVLFNPWDERDATYMDTSTGRKEYVERTKGGIWQSRESAPGKDDDGFVVWGFDQNTKIVLDVALSLLTKSREGKKPEHVLTSGQRGSPTDVSRWLSFAINEFVLKGKWSKPYDAPPNTFPWTWLGSSAILHKYFDGEKKQPVRWGQCWVFSGVYTSLARALGIPTRSVTNFDSAHDSKPFNAFSDVYLRLEP